MRGEEPERKEEKQQDPRERDEVIAVVPRIIQESSFQDGDMGVRGRLKPYLVEARCRAIGVDI